MRHPEFIFAHIMYNPERERPGGGLLSCHCMDNRYHDSPGFLSRFNRGGDYAVRLAGPCPGDLVNSVDEFVGLNGGALAIIIGEHTDCGFSKYQAADKSPESIHRWTMARTDRGMRKLLNRPILQEALRKERLALVITHSEFCDTGVRYTFCADRTNHLLQEAGLPKLSADFVEEFEEREFML